MRILTSGKRLNLVNSINELLKQKHLYAQKVETQKKDSKFCYICNLN